MTTDTSGMACIEACTPLPEQQDGEDLVDERTCAGNERNLYCLHSNGECGLSPPVVGIIVGIFGSIMEFISAWALKRTRNKCCGCLKLGLVMFLGALAFLFLVISVIYAAQRQNPAAVFGVFFASWFWNQFTNVLKGIGMYVIFKRKKILASTDPEAYIILSRTFMYALEKSAATDSAATALTIV
jgi:hypothetical protein